MPMVPKHRGPPPPPGDGPLRAAWVGRFGERSPPPGTGWGLDGLKEPTAAPEQVLEHTMSAR